MKQDVLDKWLNINDNGFRIKKVMYLDWSERLPKNVVWLDNIPHNVTFETTTYWKSIDTNITICGNIKCGKIFENIEYKYENLSFLKSHLQKCIRRGYDNSSVKTALHIIKMNQNVFLRRLAVIMIEDVALHESFGILVWLIASRICLMNRHVEWLLGLVCVLCKISHKDNYISYSGKKSPLRTLLQSKFLSLEKEQYSLLYCMQFITENTKFMNNDKKLIIKALMHYYMQFKLGNNVSKIAIRPICIKLPDLELEQWELSAIDHHCAKFILKSIKQHFDEYSENQIKELIWKNSSSINYRIKNQHSDKDWEKIKNIVVKKQYYILHKYVLMDD
tara:strand:- start:1171 stop:2172 length:1002 start_codon:yes stop_codon:yes gene_type:complete